MASVPINFSASQTVFLALQGLRVYTSGKPRVPNICHLCSHRTVYVCNKLCKIMKPTISNGKKPLRYKYNFIIEWSNLQGICPKDEYFIQWNVRMYIKIISKPKNNISRKLITKKHQSLPRIKACNNEKYTYILYEGTYTYIKHIHNTIRLFGCV